VVWLSGAVVVGCSLFLFVRCRSLGVSFDFQVKLSAVWLAYTCVSVWL